MLIKLSKFLRIFCIIFSTFSAASNYSSPTPPRNWDLNIHSDCSGDNSTDCYSFWYNTIDGNGTAIYNNFCNFVAAINIAGPAIDLVLLHVGKLAFDRWNGDVDKAIDETLADFKRAPLRVKEMTREIIVQFNNGIGKGSDTATAEFLLGKLSEYKCKHCIEQFVDIVARNIDDSQERRKNRKAFGKFANDRLSQMQCQGTHMEKEEIDCSIAPEQKIRKRVTSACCNNWGHPSHWSGVTYAAVIEGCALTTAFALDHYNRSGAVWGDWANGVNIWRIPTVYPFFVFQHWWNKDRIKSQKLIAKVKDYMVEMGAMIAVTGSVIGKIPNGIDTVKARGFIKALMLIGWPTELVTSFVKAASESGSDFRPIIDEIRHLQIEKNLPYSDSDIESALRMYDDEHIDL